MQVYKALVNGVQTVAVKIFSDQLSVSAKAGPLAEACRREIFLLRSCHDRNIVQCAPVPVSCLKLCCSVRMCCQAPGRSPDVLLPSGTPFIELLHVGSVCDVPSFATL